MSTKTASLPAAEKLKFLALDLTKPKTFPRSPRETLAGYVIGMRTLDKCRAFVAGTLGEYHFNCPLDKMFLEFTGISHEGLPRQGGERRDRRGNDRVRQGEGAKKRKPLENCEMEQPAPLHPTERTARRAPGIHGDLHPAVHPQEPSRPSFLRRLRHRRAADLIERRTLTGRARSLYQARHPAGQLPAPGASPGTIFRRTASAGVANVSLK